MRKPIVFTNIADQATDEAFNTQVRQFINFLVERIDEMIKCFHEFDEHEIQSELRDTASVFVARPSGDGWSYTLAESKID